MEKEKIKEIEEPVNQLEISGIRLLSYDCSMLELVKFAERLIHNEDIRKYLINEKLKSEISNYMG